MAGILAIVALVLSALFLGVMIVALVLLRRGEGPAYSASREYDANCREAVRTLTGDTVERIGGEQWYDPARRREPRPDEADEAAFRAAIREALGAVAPAGSGPDFDGAGHGRVAGGDGDVWVIPALSTAALRAEGLERWDGRGRLTVGLVLFNAEPPGGPATRIALPPQVLFPALERLGRDDLVRRFEELAERARTV